MVIFQMIDLAALEFEIDDSKEDEINEIVANDALL